MWMWIPHHRIKASGGTIDSDAINQAASNGHLDVELWFYKKGYGCCSDKNAEHQGHLHILKWLNTQRNKPGVRQRLHTNNAHFEKITKEYGSIERKFDVIQWMHAHIWSFRQGSATKAKVEAAKMGI
ncbi:hypothetical protein PHMEG_0002227 [Phytophthora megakarya]|uniref:Uncharacterized protein n=1 Tax=Phytophthora megakarya TaxID=4795 RepID=A0A225WYR8_9STRA|nr:hypothetical protein PHMEG_0002227 [Phytophthora megakarya]